MRLGEALARIIFAFRVGFGRLHSSLSKIEEGFSQVLELIGPLPPTPWNNSYLGCFPYARHVTVSTAVLLFGDDMVTTWWRPSG
jgi:hypothetical protein